MNKNILVIGGTRFFGKLLVQRLLMGGNTVTLATRGYAPDPFGDRVSRIRVDRRNELAMRSAFRSARYDIVFDQMCYSPVDAAIAVRTFAGKVGRYVMTSTIDVYRGLAGGYMAEDDLKMQSQLIDADYPWHDPARALESYVPGKLQAEAYLYRDGTLPLVTARLGHVLGGQGDFTGRLAYYVDMVRSGAALRYTDEAAVTSFMAPQEAARFLAWIGTQAFEGPVNGACDGALSAYDLYRKAALLLDAQPRTVKASGQAGALSPFDYPAPLALDTSRATALGYRFGHVDEWLDDAIRQHDLAFV